MADINLGRVPAHQLSHSANMLSSADYHGQQASNLMSRSDEFHASAMSHLRRMDSAGNSAMNLAKQNPAISTGEKIKSPDYFKTGAYAANVEMN